MTTTTTATTNTDTKTNTKSKRPKVLIAAAILMLLAAALSVAAPFLPRGGFGGSMGPGGAPPANGQAPGAGQTQANGQASGRGQPPANGQGFGPGGPGGVPGLPGVQFGGTSGTINFTPFIRIGEAALGGLIALLAALGLWRLKIWGRNLALVVAVASVLSAAATFLTPVLGRVPWLMPFTSSTGPAIAGLSLAVAAAVLALLPAARQAYIVKSRERRVI